jgi:hypothetical protein
MIGKTALFSASARSLVGSTVCYLQRGGIDLAEDAQRCDLVLKNHREFGMSVESIATAGLRSVIGALMRIHRASPLYPQYGPMLAKLLAAVMREKANGIIREIDGVRFELNLREMIDASLFYSGTWEVEAERTITGALKPGTIAFDIGANIGYHTFRMAKAVGTVGKVFAIEPTAVAFKKLQRNIALNSMKNIYPFNTDLWKYLETSVLPHFRPRVDSRHYL